MNLRSLREVAVDAIENEWTTAEQDWKDQAIKNLTFKGSTYLDDDNGEGSCYLYTTHYLNNNPQILHKRCDVEIRVMALMKEKES